MTLLASSLIAQLVCAQTASAQLLAKAEAAEGQPAQASASLAISAAATSATPEAATITWTTNLPASSRVDYGTAPGALAMNVSDSTMTTQHSLKVTGLTLGTKYYLKLTSVTSAGETATQELGMSDSAAPAAAPDPAPAPVWSAGPIDFSGSIDGYYSYSFNHPITHNNTWRNFDAKDGFSLNQAILSLDHTADPVGFKLALGFGRAFEIFHATEPGGADVYRHIYQAYVSLKPENWHGLQVDFGKFTTSAGAELTETYLGWNYSRSLLFANGPYYHFGLRTSVPVTKNFSAGFQLVNGWNNVEENNSGKTMGFTTALTTSKFVWNNNYYVGPEKANSNNGWRNFYDTVLSINPNGRTSALFNFDYGQEANPGGDTYKFYGYSIALRHLLGESFAISPRFDWYKDRDGFITTVAQTMKEFTVSFDYKMKEGVITRFEYRRDWSNQPFYDRGNEIASSKNMNTLLVGFMVYFGPKR